MERKQTALERMLTQKSESQLASNPIEAPKKALEPLLARGTPRFQNDEFIDADAEVERVLFPNDEEVVFVSAEEPLWACFTPQKMISTRTIAALLGLISDIFPDDILIDPLQFEMLRAGKGYHPRLLGMKMCVIAYHNRHFVAFGYCPYRKHQVSYDCERDYFDLDRKDLFCEFAQWLERGGNEIEHVTSKKEFIQEPLSNDCALHAVNNVIHFLCGQRGALDREELRKKHMNPAHPLRFLIEDRSAPIFFVSHTPCEDCGTKLRQMKSRNGDPFWGCPNLICRSEKKTAWRKAWDM